MNPKINCGSCDYHTNQLDKLVSHYMTMHSLGISDAKLLASIDNWDDHKPQSVAVEFASQKITVTNDSLREDLLHWIMSNRDVSARYWSDTIEPELKRQLDNIISKECYRARVEGKLQALNTIKRHIYNQIFGSTTDTESLYKLLDDYIAHIAKDNQ